MRLVFFLLELNWCLLNNGGGHIPTVNRHILVRPVSKTLPFMTQYRKVGNYMTISKRIHQKKKGRFIVTDHN